MNSSWVTTDKENVSAFIDACVIEGVEYVVCSPGSRNAPLVIAIDGHPLIKTYVVHDERSAAFFALGIAEITGKPVGVVCTSGSAMLNYYPAVAEAYYRGVPLVVLSADRPEEWVNHGDGQTIAQKGAYANHIRFEEVISEKDSMDLVLNKTRKAFETAKNGWTGPIHFNVPMSEPLYGTKEHEGVDYLPSKPKNEAMKELSKDVISDWQNASKKMVIVGQMEPNYRIKSLLTELSNDPSVAVLVENTSNVTGQKFIHCIDRTLAGLPESADSFEPEVLVSLGGAVISKRIKAFLRKASVKAHYRVSFNFPEMDTYRHLKGHITMTPESFLESLTQLELDSQADNYGGRWKGVDYNVQTQQEEWMFNLPFSDLKVFQSLTDLLPENTNLHLANSSVVRYAQLFEPISSVRYFSNRGTSGIDGSTSTALGVANQSKDRLNVLVTGDISFFYDSNALWNAYLPANFKILLINNAGGGIFRIIEGPRNSECLENYFEAHHDTSAEKICDAFGLNYNSVSEGDNLSQIIKSFLYASEERASVLEVITPREKNAAVLDEFFALAKEKTLVKR